MLPERVSAMGTNSNSPSAQAIWDECGFRTLAAAAAARAFGEFERPVDSLTDEAGALITRPFQLWYGNKPQADSF